MNYIILGAGGIGAFYGAKLQSVGSNVIFIARTKHLEALKNNGLKINHPTFTFDKNVKALSFDEVEDETFQNCDAIIFATKAISTEQLTKQLATKIDQNKKFPFIVSLQNGIFTKWCRK